MRLLICVGKETLKFDLSHLYESEKHYSFENGKGETNKCESCSNKRKCDLDKF